MRVGDFAGAAVLAAWVVGGPLLGGVWLRRIRSRSQSWRAFLTQRTDRPIATAFAVNLVVFPPVFFLGMLALAPDRSPWIPPVSLVAVFAAAAAVGLVLSQRPGQASR